MTRRYSLTVAFRKYNGLQEINASQPKALLLSSQKKKKDLSIPRRMTTILHLRNHKLPVLLDILNFQVSLTTFLIATHCREYSKSLSTHLS